MHLWIGGTDPPAGGGPPARASSANRRVRCKPLATNGVMKCDNSLLWMMAAVSLAAAGAPSGAGASFEAGAAPLDEVDAVLFVVRQPHRAGRGDLLSRETSYGERCEPSYNAALCRLDPRTGRREVLLQVEGGDIRGWDLDEIGGRAVLSVRQGGPEQPYHLMEFSLGLDERSPGLRRLTDGFFDDVDPVVLMDGSIVFTSTRPASGSNEVARWYQCRSDGSDVRLWEGGPESGVAPGEWDGVAVFHVRRLPQGRGWVGVAVPSAAMTREKGWLALCDDSSADGAGTGLRLLGIEAGRLAQVQEAAAGLPVLEPPLQVEHPEFCWRYPYPLGRDAFLALTDHAIWMVSGDGQAQLLHAEEAFAGELAGVRPWRGVSGSLWVGP